MVDYLMLIFTFLAAGVITVPIAIRLGLGSVLGYLLTLRRVDVVDWRQLGWPLSSGSR